MSGVLDPILAQLRELEGVDRVCAEEVAEMLDPRMKKGHVEARGSDVAIVPGGRFDAFLSERWEDDVLDRIEATVARVVGGT